MPVMLVHAMSAFSSHSTISTRPPMSADPIRMRIVNRAPSPSFLLRRCSRVMPCQKPS
jgi:hypothetical protein